MVAVFDNRKICALERTLGVCQHLIYTHQRPCHPRCDANCSLSIKVGCYIGAGLDHSVVGSIIPVDHEFCRCQSTSKVSAETVDVCVSNAPAYRQRKTYSYMLYPTNTAAWATSRRGS